MREIGIGTGYRADYWSRYQTSGKENGESFVTPGREGVNQEEKEIDAAVTDREKPAPDTETEVVVKPDGSRVLVVTVKIGGMSTTMSMKISEPTNMPDEAAKVDGTESAVKADDMGGDAVWDSGVLAES